MKCKVIILIFFAICFIRLKGQNNLVPNPSFEDTVFCPTNHGQIGWALGWINPNLASPDYFSSCNGGLFGVPSNLVGFRYAFDGNAYAGIFTYINGGYREYIEIQLLDSLKYAEKYVVEFYVSKTAYSVAINRFGAYFSDNLILSSNNLNLPFIPQIESNPNQYYTDTSGWTKITGIYQSSGGERYLTIGNFYDDNNTDTVHVGVTSPFTSYYYIDMISVFKYIEQENNELFVPNAFSPNGDGVNDKLRVLGNANKIEFKVFDRWGEMVYSYTGGEMPIGIGWDGTYKGKVLDNAVFVYYANVVLPDGKELQMKGNVSLIR